MGTPPTPTSAPVIKFLSARFGEITLDVTELLLIPQGLLGFTPFHRYAILKDPEEAPFLWLQSVDAPDLAFVIVNPFLFFPGYEIQVKAHELGEIQLDDISKATVLTIVTIPENPMELTANLRGPLLINTEKRLGKQFVLIDERYKTKHFLLKDIPPELAEPRKRAAR
ncbi:MAG TPA: flagellar assembly protein FliW [bacterium]|nr:flagellar assembly protein FliW [bacterium]HPP00908.1 flagellar assembly protein FliW [bacterium]HXK95550.1 flagellar assembly protein FliW [bacterium]